MDTEWTEAAAGIIIFDDLNDDVRLAGYVSDKPPTDQAHLVIDHQPLKSDWLDSWHHLALTYDGAQATLYVDGTVTAQRAQTGPVAQVAGPFRLGARSEAPGDLTGVIDGRLDSWALWPTALSEPDIIERMDRGLNENDPEPDPAEVDLYAGFEGPYPSVADTSHKGYGGIAVNHGTPGVADVTGEGRAFRLNHDKIVDAGWDVTTELTIPAGTPSGMYAVQAFPADLVPTQQGNPLFTHAIAVRPAPTAPRAPIAVVLPTNTWTVYNSWPGGPVGKFGPGGVVETHRKAQILGLTDLTSGIDGRFLGGLKKTLIYNGEDDIYHGGPRFHALGVRIYYITPCGYNYDRMYGGPFCLGYWVASNTDHWLWQGSLSDGDPFGLGRTAILGDGTTKTTFALGHEADTWVDGMTLPGLAEGQQPVILAEGHGLTDYSERVNDLLS